MSIWEFINPGDAFDRGYKCGLKDGQEGNKRNAPWTEEIKYATALFNREYFWKSFHDGYNTGYLDGQRMRNKVFNEQKENNTPNKLNSKNMANRQTSFSHQIELLESLKSYLHGFQERLAIVAEKYEKQVNDLYDAGGMMDETFNDFHDNYVEVTKGKIQNLINQINDLDIPFVEKEIDYLESH